MNKTVIIFIDNELQDTDVIILQSLSNKYHNIKLAIPFHNKEIIKRFNNVPFFFSTLVSTIDQMCGLIKYHPTDMYICEELGFSLDKVSTLLHNNNIKVRVYPNICQSSFPETESLKTFFIRPEDIKAYQKYVDVFEILVSPRDDRQTQKARQAIVFKAYDKEEWWGKINEIIPSFNGELDSRFVLSSFGVIRSRCGKRCAFNPNICKICNLYNMTAEMLKKHKLTIRHLQKIQSIT